MHEQLLGLAKRRSAYDHEEALAFLRARELQVHLVFGCGSFFEYIERLFGYTPQ
jgi:hypothetical protein